VPAQALICLDLAAEADDGTLILRYSSHRTPGPGKAIGSSHGLTGSARCLIADQLDVDAGEPVLAKQVEWRRRLEKLREVLTWTSPHADVGFIRHARIGYTSGTFASWPYVHESTVRPDEARAVRFRIPHRRASRATIRSRRSP